MRRKTTKTRDRGADALPQASAAADALLLKSTAPADALLLASTAA
jgi:hypothetical protein